MGVKCYSPQNSRCLAAHLQQPKQTVEDVVRRNQLPKVLEPKQVAEDCKVAARERAQGWSDVLLLSLNVTTTEAHLEYMKKRLTIHVIRVSTWTCRFGTA